LLEKWLKSKANYWLGHRPHRFPFLYFLQHFFLSFFPSTIGKAKGKRMALPGVESSFLMFRNVLIK